MGGHCKVMIRTLKFLSFFTAASAALVSSYAAAQGNPTIHSKTGTNDVQSGFIEGSALKLHNRYVFERLDYKRADSTKTVQGLNRSAHARESAYGLMLDYQSGYTRGPVGVGLDAHAYGGINVGSHADAVRSNPRFIAKDGSELKDSFGRAGAAVKLRFSNTELKWGEMRVKTPIFNSSDSRLLPETNRGWLLTSTDIAHLSLQAGRFTRWADRNSRKNGNDLLANYSGVNGDSFSFLGGNWSTPLDGLSLSAYYGHYEDVWNTWYAGGFYKKALAEKQFFTVNANVYRNTDTGQEKAGKVNNTTWSILGSYAVGAHKFGLGYQKVNGDTPFDYVNRGSIWLDNALQLSDFNAPHEASWQVKYDLDLSALITPGLSASVAYTRGSKIDYRAMNSVYANYLGLTGAGGRHWERDMQLRYVVSQGRAKGLMLQMRYSVHRANQAQGELNVNQLRFQVEMPFQIL